MEAHRVEGELARQTTVVSVQRNIKEFSKVLLVTSYFPYLLPFIGIQNSYNSHHISAFEDPFSSSILTPHHQPGQLSSAPPTSFN